MGDEICINLYLTIPDVDWIEDINKFQDLNVRIKKLETPGDIMLCGDVESLKKLNSMIDADITLKRTVKDSIKDAIGGGE